MRWFIWRVWLSRLDRLWRSSLQVRTVAISVIMSAIAVGIIGAYMSFSIGNNFFDARLDQALSVSERSNVVAQTRFDAAQQTVGLDLDVAMKNASTAVQQSSSTAAGTDLAILRSPGQSGPRLPVDLVSPGLDPDAAISAELRRDVERSDDRRLFWQSISLPREDGGTDAGLVVGSLLDVPTSGQYELYLVYNLSDTQQSLAFVQLTLWLGLSTLVVLIGAVTYTVVRLIVAPVRLAPRRARSSPRASSRCASQRRATTSSRPSPGRSTGWRRACRGRSPGSPASRRCSSASCPTCRTSCARR